MIWWYALRTEKDGEQPLVKALTERGRDAVFLKEDYVRTRYESGNKVYALQSKTITHRIVFAGPAEAIYSDLPFLGDKVSLLCNSYVDPIPVPFEAIDEFRRSVSYHNAKVNEYYHNLVYGRRAKRPVYVLRGFDGLGELYSQVLASCAIDKSE